MADKLLSTIAGGGGIFRAETFVHDQTIATGQTGDLVTIGTAGKTTKLTLLSTSTVSAQSGISIDADGVIIVGPETLSDSTPNIGSGFFVSEAFGVANTAQGAAKLIEVIGEFITFKKDAGNTTEELIYSYVIGVIK